MDKIELGDLIISLLRSGEDHSIAVFIIKRVFKAIFGNVGSGH